jgi:single stranded DNA-binding protein (ssb)
MNKVILMGRLTKDPELRYTSTSNIAKCSFTIAVDRRFSKPGEEKQADFIPIVAWKNTAEFCSKYFTKGLKVVVVGSMQNRSWDDNEGKKHYITEVVADETYFADSKKNEGGSVPKPIGEAAPGQADGFYPLDEDDDLPF